MPLEFLSLIIIIIIIIIIIVINSKIMKNEIEKGNC